MRCCTSQPGRITRRQPASHPATSFHPPAPQHPFTQRADVQYPEQGARGAITKGAQRHLGVPAPPKQAPGVCGGIVDWIGGSMQCSAAILAVGGALSGGTGAGSRAATAVHRWLALRLFADPSSSSALNPRQPTRCITPHLAGPARRPSRAAPPRPTTGRRRTPPPPLLRSWRRRAAPAGRSP